MFLTDEKTIVSNKCFRRNNRMKEYRSMVTNSSKLYRDQEYHHFHLPPLPHIKPTNPRNNVKQLFGLVLRTKNYILNSFRSSIAPDLLGFNNIFSVNNILFSLFIICYSKIFCFFFKILFAK